ncbi:MAG: redox-sensing transcriptional repressor Rex [Spirochaetia bacterium]
MQRIPEPTLTRLTSLYRYLRLLQRGGKQNASSAFLGNSMGVPAHTIRKDLTYIERPSQSGAGYNIEELAAAIAAALGMDIPRKACIVGLGRLGAAVLNYPELADNTIQICAGFDSDTNRLELLQTDIPVYPSYQIPEIVRSAGIELAVIAVPPEAAQLTLQRLTVAGIQGIINFSPVYLEQNNSDIVIRNIFLIEELQVLSARICLKEAIKNNPENREKERGRI